MEVAATVGISGALAMVFVSTLRQMRAARRECTARARRQEQQQNSCRHRRQPPLLRPCVLGKEGCTLLSLTLRGCFSVLCRNRQAEESERGRDEETVASAAPTSTEELLTLLYAIADDQAHREGVVHRGITCNMCGTSPVRHERSGGLQCWEGGGPVSDYVRL